MRSAPGIGYHSAVQLMSKKAKYGKYICIFVALLAGALFIMSKQYILLVWSLFILGYIGLDLYRANKITKTLAEHEMALTDYLNKAMFPVSVQNENFTFKMSDKGIKNLCSFDSINHADELLRTVIVCKDEEIYMRIRLICREKIYAQVRQIPMEVAVDLWTTSQEEKAFAEGKASPFDSYDN